MTLILFLIFLAIIGCFIKNRSGNSLLAFCLLTIMAFMAALRGPDVGADTSTYLANYNNYALYQRYSSEFLFYIIVDFFYSVRIGANWCQFFITLITYLPLGWVILRKTKNSCLSVLVFIISTNGYFFETFNITRQAAATSFLLCAYVWLEDRRIKPAIFALSAAVGMHTSSIIYLPFILLAWKIKVPTKLVYYSVIGTLIFAFFISSVDTITNAILYFSAFGIGGTEKYEHFADYELDQARNLNGLITLLVPLSALCLYAYNNYKGHIIMRIFFLGVIFLNIVSIMPTSYRMAYGLTCIEILLYPMIFYSGIKRKWIAVSILIITLFFHLWKLDSTLTGSLLIPYNTF